MSATVPRATAVDTSESAAGQPGADGDAPVALLPEQRWATPVRGRAYRASARWFVGSTLIGVIGYGAEIAVRRPDVAWPVIALIIAGGAVMLVTAWYMLTGYTTIDARGLRQDWFSDKRFAWHEIARVRHLKMPFTSRLLVSTGRGPVRAIHGGTRELDDAFREIAAYYNPRK